MKWLLMLVCTKRSMIQSRFTGGCVLKSRYAAEQNHWNQFQAQTAVGAFQDKLLWIKYKFVFKWLMTEKNSFQLTVILPSGQFSTDKQRKTQAPPVLPKIFKVSICRLFRALICFNRGRKQIGKKLLFKKERSTVPIPSLARSLQHHDVLHQHQGTSDTSSHQSRTGCTGTTAPLSLPHALESHVSIYKVMS